MKDSKIALLFIGLTIALLGVAIVFRNEAEAPKIPETSEEIPTYEPVEPTEPVPPVKVDTDNVVAGTVEGIVTEIFEDCSRKRVFENGKVVDKKDEISCDGGSYVIVDGFRINTVSGYTSEEFAFFYDVGDLLPGENVRAIYQLDSFEQPNFDCDECGIERL